MIFAILAAFIGIPIAEIYIFIQAGGALGAFPVIIGVFVTAVIGAILVRAQGLDAMRAARADMNEGRPPVTAAVHGLFLVVAGALLLTPGFLTDALGFALLIPPFRLWLGRSLLERLRGRIVVIEGR
ncbi:MAG: FxsA family protein [Pseudomonadota bacterium]